MSSTNQGQPRTEPREPPLNDFRPLSFLTRSSQNQIGDLFGMRDHRQVTCLQFHSVRVVSNLRPVFLGFVGSHCSSAFEGTRSASTSNEAALIEYEIEDAWLSCAFIEHGYPFEMEHFRMLFESNVCPMPTT
jgi:hypothetical protein